LPIRNSPAGTRTSFIPIELVNSFDSAAIVAVTCAIMNTAASVNRAIIVLVLRRPDPLRRAIASRLTILPACAFVATDDDSAARTGALRRGRIVAIAVRTSGG